MRGFGLEVDLRENAGEESALTAALKSGRIWYADGEFSGNFNAEIVRELREIGATLNKRRAVYSINPDALPIEIRSAAGQSLDRSRSMHQALQDTLGQIQANQLGLGTGLDVTEAVTGIVHDLGAQFDSTVDALDVVEIPAELTAEMTATINAELTENLELYIGNFLDHEIVELRQLVQANAFAGYRADRLVDIIEARYGVSKRKAAFLADQETGLLVAKYREVRYRSIGSTTYKWSTSHDDLVRPDHKILNGTIQAWTEKPITNRKTGARNNPGEDFRCRCVAMAIIDGLGDSGVYANARDFRCSRTAPSLSVQTR